MPGWHGVAASTFGGERVVDLTGDARIGDAQRLDWWLFGQGLGWQGGASRGLFGSRSRLFAGLDRFTLTCTLFAFATTQEGDAE